MPVIIVRGMPSGAPKLPELIETIQRTVANIRPLELHRDQVSVFFPVDLCQDGLGEEIVVTVEGLFKGPERTSLVRQRLADGLMTCIAGYAREHVKQCVFIEALVPEFDQDTSGYAVARSKHPSH